MKRLSNLVRRWPDLLVVAAAVVLIGLAGASAIHQRAEGDTLRIAAGEVRPTSSGPPFVMAGT